MHPYLAQVVAAARAAEMRQEAATIRRARSHDAAAEPVARLDAGIRAGLNRSCTPSPAAS
jgi:hypothetical protein